MASLLPLPRNSKRPFINCRLGLLHAHDTTFLGSLFTPYNCSKEFFEELVDEFWNHHHSSLSTLLPTLLLLTNSKTHLKNSPSQILLFPSSMFNTFEKKRSPVRQPRRTHLTCTPQTFRIRSPSISDGKEKLQAASVISIHTRLCFHRYASRYEETKGPGSASFQASLRHPVIFSKGNYPEGPACSRCTCHGHHYQRLVARQEVVASSRTYLEPPRRIKARPTGLRLERSPVPVPLPALRTIYYSPLFSASIPVADFILRRRRPRRFPTCTNALRFSRANRTGWSIRSMVKNFNGRK